MNEPPGVPWPAPPRGSRDSAFFWEGVARRVLLGQRCKSCERFRHPPRPLCPYCHSFEWEAVELSGRGTLHSWIKPVHPKLPMFPDDYLVALVDLEEGMRLLSNLCEVELDEIANDMPVEVCFAPTTEGGWIHHFRPRGNQEDG